MLTPSEIRGLADRKYPFYLRSLVIGETIFPLRVRFGVPSSTGEFSKLREEVTELVSGNFGYTIEWEEKDTRKWGRQKLPTQVRFDTEQQFVAALEKQEEVAKFKENLNLTLARLPQLRAWLVSHAKSLVEYESAWQGLVAVCEYFVANPKPGLYLRQLPIPVHTKFVGENRQIISSMLEAVLPPEARNTVETFEGRFGLKECDSLIRLRVLDPRLLPQLGVSHDDMGLPLSVFGKLPISGLRVIITENLMNFLCLPTMEHSLAIFGHGGAAELLTRVDWLGNCRVFYWGDIDEYGFHILARLRAKFPSIRSLLMDLKTLQAFRSLAGKGEPAGKAPVNLTAEEAEAYKEIVQRNMRIEQEKIHLTHFVNALKNADLGDYSPTTVTNQSSTCASFQQ